MSAGRTNLNIRKVDPDGAEATLFRSHLHRLVGSAHTGKPRVRSTLPEGSVVLVAEGATGAGESDGKVVQVGSVAIKPLKFGEATAQNLPDGIRLAEVKRMVVLPKFQGTGTAKQLLLAIEDIGKTELDAQCIVLETLHNLPQARRFYEKNGYQKRDVYGIYGAEDSQCYEKWL